MGKKYLTFFIVFFFILFIHSDFTIAAKENIKEVISTGMSGGVSPQSRDKAIDDALRQAVSQGVGVYISSETTVEQMQLVEDRIYSESMGYVKSYTILNENKDDGVYEVKISALVKMDRLAGDLEAIGLLMRKKQTPRVMVVIYSKELKDSFVGITLEGNRNAENLIESRLIAKGFQLVDAGQVRRKKELESLLLKGNPSLAGKLAGDFGAEVLIEGDVRRKFLNERMVFGNKISFFTNEIRLKAMETDTSKVLFSGYRTRSPSGSSAMQPLEEATRELSDEMIAGILEQWKKDIYESGNFQLNISGASFTNITDLKEELNNIRGISNIRVRNFKARSALIEVKFKGTLDQLAENINKLKNLSLIIVGLQSNTIDMKFKN